MTLIDQRGRLFGRLNLIDALIGSFILVLIPIAYGTWLLFRPAVPKIGSVERVPITKEERRLAGGSRLSAKLKVRGSGFRPMLRATIDDTPALGFVFENPNSADVMVGEAAPGSHDLVIYDGVQEVARAVKAVTIQAVPPSRVRVAGTLFDLDEATAGALRLGPITGGSAPQGEIVALGNVRPGRRRLATGRGEVDVTVAGRWERQVVMILQCDLDPNSEDCAVGGIPLTAVPLPVIQLMGPASTRLSLAIDELLPIETPRRAEARVRFAGAHELLELIRAGDHDAGLDDRAATVTAIGRRVTDRGMTTVDATVRLGVDESRDGWRYRGRPASPGAPFTLTTDRYIATGSVIALIVAPKEAERQ
jgi:Domain of unknown function (DUF4330)